MKLNKVYLKHIIDEINFITDEIEKLSYDTFIESEIYTRAFSRSIEIIGEAIKNLSVNFKEIHNDIEWKKISGMRDKLIHQYFSVDYEIVWDVVKNKLPVIRKKLLKILDAE
ncbi:MAG: DUF86 domain-containing protein [Ignavibacteriaceae bacterium]